VGLVGLAAVTLGGCAQGPVSQRVTTHSKEYFPGSMYGKPSPRVVAYGEPVPRGGGFYMVGKPYSVAGKMFFPTEKQRATIGLASWYGEAFHGRRTANGEVYDCDALTAAHPTMPLPSYARVTNLDNRHSLIVRVNDRGPFHENRVLDVSRKTAEVLDFHGTGTSRVKVEYIGPAGLDGSDDVKLIATLRTNGPAVFASKDRASDLELASSTSSDPASALPPLGIRHRRPLFARHSRNDPRKLRAKKS
jgi:rare lipoprotein A